MQHPPSTITLQISSPCTPLTAGNSNVGIRKRCACPRRRNRFHHCRHHCTHQCTHPIAPPSTSVAFFVTLFLVTLRFSNLVPYVAILKTFHVKKHRKHQYIYIDVFLKNIDVKKYRCFPNIAEH